MISVETSSFDESAGAEGASTEWFPKKLILLGTPHTLHCTKLLQFKLALLLESLFQTWCLKTSVFP
jgi:hypothetical protein